jgi:hypothetical protein
MAQTGFTPILIYSSSTTTNAPAVADLTNSTLGSELAINITDGKLFYKDNANAIQVIAWKVTPTTAGGTGLTSYTAGDMLYYASGTVLSKLAIGATGRYMSSTGSAPQWSAPAALTKTDDTNVTLTLGGSASTALLNAASLTLGWTGTLAVTRGGTGLSTVAQGDILYGSAANTLVALAKNASATRYLSNTGATNNPAWAQIDLSNGVTGTLPVGNGGTGNTTFTAGYIPYGNGGSALSTSANLQYNGTTLMVGTSSAAPGSGAIQLVSKNTVCLGTNDTSGYYALACYFNGSYSGSVSVSSGATAFNTSSDFRLKNDLGVAVDGSVIDNTVIHDYTWKTDGRVDRGVFAQEAHAVKPSAIAIGKDAEDGSIVIPWGVDYSKYVPDIIVHAQQLKKSLVDLRADFEAYKAAHP